MITLCCISEASNIVGLSSRQCCSQSLLCKKKVTMASEELDPTFRRALNLLHSTSVDSAQQLKLMLDEAIRTRREQGAQSEDQVVAPRSLTEGYKPEVINRVTEVATPRTAWAWAWAEMRPREKRVRPETAWAWAWLGLGAEMRPREKRVRPET